MNSMVLLEKKNTSFVITLVFDIIKIDIFSLILYPFSILVLCLGTSLLYRCKEHNMLHYTFTIIYILWQRRDMNEDFLV